MKEMKAKRWGVIGLNILIMAAVAALLGWLAMSWLDVWTGHSKEVTVPSVSGMNYDDAYQALMDQGFIVVLSDSVHDSKARPGVVLKQNPVADVKVKPGRTIYLTINAFSPKMVTLPRLTDMSARQARTILEGLGINKNNILEQPVISEYENLVMGVKMGDRRLSAGARVPLNAVITLEVGDGLPDPNAVDSLHAVSNDSIAERLDLF